MTAPPRCALSAARASLPSPTFRQFGLGGGDDSDVRPIRSGGLNDTDLLIPLTDSGLSPDKAAAIERGGTEVVRA